MNIKLSLLALGGALLLIGCYTEHHQGYARGPAVEASYTYEYYPESEVYYYPQRHVYYWSEGGTWHSGPRVPPKYVLHSSVRVNLSSPEPYRQHEQVRAQHPRPPEEKQSGHSQQDHDQH